MTQNHRSEQVVVVIDGVQRTYTRDDDGLMWSYHTSEGRRWIGWRALAEQFTQMLDERAKQGCA